MKSLKAKLVLAISLFIVVLLSISAFLQIEEKRQELVTDIYTKSRAYAELTSRKIVDDYKLFLVPNSFVYFNREMNETLSKNDDIRSVKIMSYSGEVLYDSTSDKERKYEGPTRLINNEELLTMVRAKKMSLITQDEEVFYLDKKTDEDGHASYVYVDQNDKPIGALKSDQLINFIVAPVDEEFSIIYDVSYDALTERIFATQIRILLLAAFGVSLGIFLAILFSLQITKPLYNLRKGAEILATGDLSYRVKVKTHDEIRKLADTFNQMAADLQESTKALVFKERVSKELELAGEIQSQIIPKCIPQVRGLDVAAGIIPADEVGGDCYDFLKLSEDEMIFYLGDVTGHGVPSGIVVSIANALFYSYAGRGNLTDIIAEVNKVLKAKTMSNMFVTLVLMRWLVQEQKFSYVSAGHEQIVHYIAREDRVELLPSGGLGLGMIPDISKQIKVQDVDLEKGDILFIYSDGIPEAWKNEKELYGMERLKSKVKQYASLPNALSIKNALISDVYIFREGYKQMDDITCIVVKKT